MFENISSLIYANLKGLRFIPFALHPYWTIENIEKHWESTLKKPYSCYETNRYPCPTRAVPEFGDERRICHHKDILLVHNTVLHASLHDVALQKAGHAQKESRPLWTDFSAGKTLTNLKHKEMLLKRLQYNRYENRTMPSKRPNDQTGCHVPFRSMTRPTKHRETSCLAKAFQGVGFTRTSPVASLCTKIQQGRDKWKIFLTQRSLIFRLESPLEALQNSVVLQKW